MVSASILDPALNRRRSTHLALGRAGSGRSPERTWQALFSAVG